MSQIGPVGAMLLLAAVGVPASAHADQPIVGAPTVALAPLPYSDMVRLPPNAGGIAWHKISDGTTAAGQVQEYVPVHETGVLWSQIITVKTLARGRDPKQIVAGTVNLMREICGRINITNTAQHEHTGEAAGLGMSLPIYDESETLVTCQQPNITKLRQKLGTDNVTLRRYEVTWYKMIKGRQANYIVQRAWHADAIDETCLLGSDAVLGEWKSWITHVTLVRHDNEPVRLR
jgi:hypothetical protein